MSFVVLFFFLVYRLIQNKPLSITLEKKQNLENYTLGFCVLNPNGNKKSFLTKLVVWALIIFMIILPISTLLRFDV